MDVCWNYYTASPGFNWNSAGDLCRSQGSGLMILEKYSKFQYFMLLYFTNIYFSVYNYDIWVSKSNSNCNLKAIILFN